MPSSPRARRRPASSGAFVFALLAAALIAAGGCSTVRKISGKDRDKTPPSRYLPAENIIVGRVLAYRADDQLALVELSLIATPPFDLRGRELVARDPRTLAPTARLQASFHRRGRVLGAFVLSGSPSPDDEVVAPTAEPPPPPAGPETPDRPAAAPRPARD